MLSQRPVELYKYFLSFITKPITYDSEFVQTLHPTFAKFRVFIFLMPDSSLIKYNTSFLISGFLSSMSGVDVRLIIELSVRLSRYQIFPVEL